MKFTCEVHEGDETKQSVEQKRRPLAHGRLQLGSYNEALYAMVWIKERPQVIEQTKEMLVLEC
jgi:hypothetical protein